MERLSAPNTPWFALLGLAIAPPCFFMVLAVCVRRAGIVLTDMAQRMSVVLPMLAAFLLFGETAGLCKIIGLSLGLVAVAGILYRLQQSTGTKEACAWPVLLTVWVGLALIDVLPKCIAAAGMPFAPSLQLSFLLAVAGMFLWQAIRVRRRQTRIILRNCFAGLLLGTFNFANIFVRQDSSDPQCSARRGVCLYEHRGGCVRSLSRHVGVSRKLVQSELLGDQRDRCRACTDSTWMRGHALCGRGYLSRPVLLR